MNYRHVFHAGNFADVIKHISLISVLRHLRRKEKPFCVIDTHAGRGLYDIESSEAARSREAGTGIARIRDLALQAGLPDSLSVYLDCVKSEGEGHYPGSPRLAARLLRPQDRLVAIEKQPEEAEALAKALAGFSRARAIAGDAYASLAALLPPRERRGLVLIDPPYEADDEFLRVAALLEDAYRRFATGIYLLWLPMKSRNETEALGGELRTQGIVPAIRVDIDTDASGGADKRRLSSAGVIVVNPPYTFEREMRAAAQLLAPRLGHSIDAPAQISLTTL
ncbi:MAG TPA: 23S rRNA (adenine(2030)-N(6))-methyltransferase RlmJ [Rhizomicrobium sp.]|jgi:23S rRNA (adenine2030-N6)-methyltransferase|nr:23S rRNA (adenine(2030)-N(6))-methyltransferase RlmJ [Rhizomicrobium sp.]